MGIRFELRDRRKRKLAEEEQGGGHVEDERTALLGNGRANGHSYGSDEQQGR
jgi:hypothetical protein